MIINVSPFFGDIAHSYQVVRSSFHNLIVSYKQTRLESITFILFVEMWVMIKAVCRLLTDVTIIFKGDP